MRPAYLLQGTTVPQALSSTNTEYAHWQSIEDKGRNIQLVDS